MDDPSNFPTDDRWVRSPANRGGITFWPAPHATFVPDGHARNIWDPYTIRNSGAYCDEDVQSDSHFNNAPPNWATGLPRPFPTTMPGLLAQNQSTPNASSVYPPSHFPISYEPRQKVFERNFQTHKVNYPVCKSPILSHPDNTWGINDASGLNEQSTLLVIRTLQKQVQDQDKELKFIRGLLERQERRPEAGTTAKRSRKRPREKSSRSESSDSDGSLIHTAPVPAKRGRFNEIARMQTAATRECGACIRCRRLKKRCELGEDLKSPCVQCRELSLSYQRIPCIRTRIIDIQLFRQGTSENDTWTTREEIYAPRDLNSYYPSPSLTIDLTQGFGPNLQVQVRRFLPVSGDETSYHWTSKDGTQHELPMPTYAIVDTISTRATLDQYVENHIFSYVEAQLDSGDFMLWETFQMALMAKHPLFHKTLKLWMAARLIETPWNICGEETLGIPRVTEADSPWYGTIPVTPIMDTQLDQIVIQSILSPLRKEVLQMLQAKFDKFQPKDWFELFATVFILLNTIEIATAHDHEFATCYGHVSPNGGRRFEDYRLIESLFHGAQTLIAHFRDAPDGHLPLIQSATAPGKVAKMAEMDPEETNFMCKLRNYLNDGRREIAFEKLKTKHAYETPMYWGHQLCTKTWEGKPVHIQEIEGA